MSSQHMARRGRIIERAGLLAALALAGIGTGAMAADKALLVGVGKFVNTPSANLPGIDKDVAMMDGVARRLGYTQIVKLQDEAATRRAILDAMQRVLVTETGADDRVLIYFSSHGTGLADDNDDEEDGQDEAILASDVRIGETPEGRAKIGGVILDDEIAALVARSKAKSVTLIVDACQSGTVDKSVSFARPVMGNSTGVKKVFMWPGFRGGKRSRIFHADVSASSGNSGPANYVALTAAGDNEYAQATNSGSMFTVGITQAISAASADGQVSPRQIVENARKYIAGQTSGKERFKPEIHGAVGLMDRTLPLTRTNAGGGPNWTQVSQIATRLAPIPVTGLKDRYLDGQELQMTFNLPADGYLNVISVGPDDTVTLLFPNHLQQDNRVKAGTMALPGELKSSSGDPLYFPVTAPYGKTMVMAVLTKAAKNLYTNATDANDNKGLRTPSFAAISDLISVATAERAFSVAARPSGPTVWATKAEMLTCGAKGC